MASRNHRPRCGSSPAARRPGLADPEAQGFSLGEGAPGPQAPQLPPSPLRLAPRRTRVGALRQGHSRPLPTKAPDPRPARWPCGASGSWSVKWGHVSPSLRGGQRLHRGDTQGQAGDRQPGLLV